MSLLITGSPLTSGTLSASRVRRASSGLMLATASYWLRCTLPVSSCRKCERFRRSITGPFTSDRWSVIPPSFSRWLIASRLSSAEVSIAFTAGHSRITWRIDGLAATASLIRSSM